MAVTLPIVNGSAGVWGTILNDAITDIDNRLITATNKNNSQDTTITALNGRVSTLETAPSSVGQLQVCTSSTRPALAVGKIIFETDTASLYYGAQLSGSTFWAPWPGTYMGKLRQSTTNQNLSPSAPAAISFNTCDNNRMNGWSSGAPTRYTAPVSGIYEFTGAVSFGGTATATGYRSCHWRTSADASNPYPASTATVPPFVGTSQTIVTARTFIAALSASGWVELWAAHSNSAAISTSTSGGEQSAMVVRYLGAA